MSFQNWKWFIEYTHPTQAHMHGVKKYLYSSKTQFQDIEIVETDFFGRCLILDGKIQSAQFDEYIYHEALIHPAMILHPLPKKILVVGGGEGAVLREILKYTSVEKLVMVDIDREVVEICKRYLPSWSQGAYEDNRVKTYFMDARKYLEENTDRWDLIFMDLTEPLDDNASYLLFTKEFYSLAAERLEKGGGIALQAGNFNPGLFQCHAAIFNTLQLVFKHVDSYGTFIPSFDTKWGFIYASPENTAFTLEPTNIDEELSERNIRDLQFYDGLTHVHMFALTKNLRELRAKETRIIKDSKPLFTY